MTNLAELAGSLRPHYWSQVGTTGLNGSIEHGKLRVSSVDALAPSSVSSIQVGDLVSWEAPLMGFAPAALNFSRAIDKTLPVNLLVERRNAPARRISTNALAPISEAQFVDYAFQIGGDLVFALVGARMIFRRSGDKSVCALGIAMICWSSNVPNVSASPLFDALFVINQFTARMWYEVLLVYWAIHLVPTSRWGLSRALVRIWPVWAVLSVAVALGLNFVRYFPGVAELQLLQNTVDGNHYLMYAFTIAALAEGVVSARGETRTRIKWGLLIFGGSFLLFPIPDYALQMILPLGLLYATLRHRLLDFGFAVNRGLVFGVVSSALLLCFFGLEKLSEHFIHLQSHSQNAMLDGAIAVSVFLIFHKLRHRVEHAIENLFFSSWHKKETALRLCVAKSVHITQVGPLLAGFVSEVDQFCDQAGCAIYRSGDASVVHLAQGSIAGAPVQVDADDPLVVAMRFERRPVRSEEIAGAAPGSVVFRRMYRGVWTASCCLTAARSATPIAPTRLSCSHSPSSRLGWTLRRCRPTIIVGVRRCWKNRPTCCVPTPRTRGRCSRWCWGKLAPVAC